MSTRARGHLSSGWSNHSTVMSLVSTRIDVMRRGIGLLGMLPLGLVPVAVQEVIDDCSRVKYLQPDEAVEYGIVDEVITNTEKSLNKPSYMSYLQ